MGRPREFQIDEAIEKATHLFWRRGYEGTSLSELTHAMGISPPSFYFAFSSKENLFRKVVERYSAEQMAVLEKACEAPTVQAVVTRLLYGYADFFTGPDHAPGCLAMNSALPFTSDDPVRIWLASLREDMRLKLRERFGHARRAGDLAASLDLDALSRFVVVIVWGMAVEAQAGASRKDLHKMVALELERWAY